MASSLFGQKVSGFPAGKRYILLLQRVQWIAEQELKLISKAAELALPGHTFIRFEDVSEGIKALKVKNVDVVLLHHSLFKSEAELVELAKEFKNIRKATVIFITKSDRDLISAYREKMSLYEELDDYVTLPLDAAELVKKIKKAGTVDARAAKRFLIKIPVQVTRVDSLKTHAAILDDLSLVGCSLTVDSDYDFHREEQLRLQLPLHLMEIFHPHYGDYLKLALRVRRLSMRGETLGCSIEHLTSMQNECLTSFLEDISRRQRNAGLTSNQKKGAELNAK